MDVTRVRQGIEGVRGELKKLFDNTLEAGRKDVKQLDGLRSLGRVDASLEKALGRLDDAVKRTTPKEKKTKEAKGKK